jgi:hypothetical protein
VQFNSLGYGKNVIDSLFLSTVSEDGMMDMLKASAQSELTLYSNIFNLNNGDITIFHNHNFDQAARLNLYEEMGKGPHIINIASLFNSQDMLGDNVINPLTILPLYTRIMLYAIGLYMLFGSVIFVIAIIKDKERTKIKMTTHLTAIIAGVDAVVILLYMYFRWGFVFNYGFSILGFLPHMLAWGLVALTLLHAAMCIAAFVRKQLTKAYRILYLISSILLLLITTEMLLNGFLRL